MHTQDARQVGIRTREWGSPAASPSRALAQWHVDTDWLADRCGGSAGMAHQQSATGFPFHPSITMTGGLLDTLASLPPIGLQLKISLDRASIYNACRDNRSAGGRIHRPLAAKGELDPLCAPARGAMARNALPARREPGLAACPDQRVQPGEGRREHGKRGLP